MTQPRHTRYRLSPDTIWPLKGVSRKPHHQGPLPGSLKSVNGFMYQPSQTEKES